MVRGIRTALVVTALLAGTLVATATPASAETTSCFYSKQIKTGTQVIRADYNGDGKTDKCFAIAPDRTIWNSWSGSNGWHEMPNNGRADDMCDWGHDANGFPMVFVWLNDRRVYSSTYDLYAHKWLAWDFEGYRLACGIIVQPHVDQAF